MENTKNILITLSNGQYLLRVALKVSSDYFKGDVLEYPLEPENKKQIAEVLPAHCKSFGEIVEVQDIFEVADLVTNNF